VSAMANERPPAQLVQTVLGGESVQLSKSIDTPARPVGEPAGLLRQIADQQGPTPGVCASTRITCVTHDGRFEAARRAQEVGLASKWLCVKLRRDRRLRCVRSRPMEARQTQLRHEPLGL
jgi:hypothetical protein